MGALRPVSVAFAKIFFAIVFPVGEMKEADLTQPLLVRPARLATTAISSSKSTGFFICN